MFPKKILGLAIDHNIEICISIFQSYARLNVSGISIVRGLKAATSQVCVGSQYAL